MIHLIFMNTQEWFRQKFLQVVLFLSIVYILLSYLLGSLSLNEQMRIKYDLGLAGLEMVALLVAAFLGSHALFRDIDRKTIQVILARPISRWNILAGYLGAIFILNSVLIFFLGLTMFYFFNFDGYLFNFIVSLFTIILKSAVIGVFGIAASCLARPMFSLVLAISFWILSYSITDIIFFIQKVSNENHIWINKTLAFLIPQFYLFNWKNYTFLKTELNLSEVLWSWSHCLGWIFLLFLMASIFIRRKDLV